MENNLKLDDLKNVLNALKERREVNSGNLYYVARLLGYIEACLKSFGVLETELVPKKGNQIKVNIVKSDKWWKQNRKETLEESLVRQSYNYIQCKDKT